MSVNQVNQATGALSPIAGGTLYADAPVGSIQAYGGATAPFGWLLCQGQAISRTTYAELFGVIGTSYGSGDGSTTFNVPDLRGKVLAGYNSSETEFNALGKTGGEKTHTLTVDEMPAHSHVPKNSSSQNMTLIGDGSGNNPIPIYSSSPSYAKTSFAYLANAGGGGAHNNLQPYSTVSYIIKATTIALPSDFEDAVDEKFTSANSTLKDSTPTQNSVKPITSGGVYSSLADLTYQAIRNVALDSSATPFASLTTKDIQCGLLHIITFVAVLKVGQSFGDTKVATLPFNITASSYFAMSCWKSDAGLMGYIKTNGEIYMAGYNTSSSNAFELRGSCIVTTSTVYK